MHVCTAFGPLTPVLGPVSRSLILAAIVLAALLFWKLESTVLRLAVLGVAGSAAIAGIAVVLSGLTLPALP